MPVLQINDKFANRYRLKKRIGVGGYSQVWLAEDTLAGNMEVAIKIFAPDKGLDTDGIETFAKEFTLVFNINHTHLLRPMHYEVSEGSPFLVMQYCSKGSLFKRIGEISEMELARFMQQSASALNYLHQQDPPIIHQDIKPDNFLIDNNGNYLLADFGISSKIRRTLTKSIGSQASTGTLAYMPPEKFSADKQIIKAGDIFSLGVTMYELLTGDLPFGDHGGMVLLNGAQVPNLTSAFSLELNALLKSCLSKNPWERPPAEKLEEAAAKFLQTGKWSAFGSATPNPAPVPPKEPDPFIGGRTTQPIPESVLGPLPTPPPNPPQKPKTNYWPIIATVLLVLVLGVSFAWWFTSPIVENTDVRVYTGSTAVIGTTLADSLVEMAQTEIPTMVFVKGSTFNMGREDGEANEKPKYSVRVSDFYMGRYEVTQKQWQYVMGNNPSYFSGCDYCPVEQVSWNDVQEFIQKLNQKTGKDYRLPTEAEWEYAARGGRRSSGCTFSGSNIVGNVAWYSGISESKTHPVGRKHANELGLFDMSGNVWEWCSDRYRTNSSSNQTSTKKSTDSTLCAIRGGGWLNDAKGCKTTFRSFKIPSSRLYSIGFRLVTSD
jgi:formylglycine-generating enzyme required for sulfatase activity